MFCEIILIDSGGRIEHRPRMISTNRGQQETDVSFLPKDLSITPRPGNSSAVCHAPVSRGGICREKILRTGNAGKRNWKRNIITGHEEKRYPKSAVALRDNNSRVTLGAISLLPSDLRRTHFNVIFSRALLKREFSVPSQLRNRQSSYYCRYDYYWKRHPDAVVSRLGANGPASPTWRLRSVEEWKVSGFR